MGGRAARGLSRKLACREGEEEGRRIAAVVVVLGEVLGEEVVEEEARP